MIEIRFHGRGGQGAVIASKVLAVAIFSEGRFVQSFPAFGVERRGAPVMAFVRVDEAYIDLRCEVYHPNNVIVLDPSLLESVDVTAGLSEEGTAFARQTGIVGIDSVVEAITGEVPFKQNENAQAARDAFERVVLNGGGRQP